MNVNTEIDRLDRLSLAAHADAERKRIQAQQLIAEFERCRLELRPAEYSLLQAKVQQAQLRADEAHRVAQQKQAALDAARTAESARTEWEALRLEYDHKTAELARVHQTLIDQRRQAEQLKDALMLGGRMHDELQRQLGQLKLRMAQNTSEEKTA